ncbi:hypothetical protein GWI33_007901 [Rhynchophorus ferrugineus]|uniref:Uncharacterized protein n=1 Tax=Rhynchophorus ferrugineus TaxID=354439 RepID=A0A834MGD0_RHYFE|nr:hypothetical protein GWI33_007901 [Rhynchophorus ferrugineus]
MGKKKNGKTIGSEDENDEVGKNGSDPPEDERESVFGESVGSGGGPRSSASPPARHQTRNAHGPQQKTTPPPDGISFGARP